MLFAGYPHITGRSFKPVGICNDRGVEELEKGVGDSSSITMEARKLEHEHGRPPTPIQRKQENRHNSSHIHVPPFWSLR